MAGGAILSGRIGQFVRRHLAVLMTLGAGLPLVAHANEWLPHDLMLGRGDLAQPVRTSAFSGTRVEALPGFDIKGRLRIDPVPSQTHFSVLRDTFGRGRRLSTPDLQMPGFVVDLIQVESEIVPTMRGIPMAGHPEWDVIVEPGRVWMSAADGGYARVALPFALLEKNANCTHNGLLTFLMNGEGKTSRAAFQIGSETCAYLQFDLWGMAQVSFDSGIVENAEQIGTTYLSERKARLPVKPLSQLSEFGVDVGRLMSIDATSVSAYGVAANGVHFAGACNTRYGEYPYCDALTLPSFSLAKSIVAGIAYLRLSFLFPAFGDSRISDHVPACSDAPQWAGVTIANVLDMATGNYDSSAPKGDEDADKMATLFLAETHADKIAFGCAAYRRRDPPGKTWAYHTSDTYVGGTHMDSYFRAHAGRHADVHRDLVVGQLYKTLRLSPATTAMRRTLDSHAQAFFGWGMTLNRDDIVRIARFLMDSQGLLENRPYLDRRELAAAMQKDPARRGLPAGSPDLRYQKGFWGLRLVASEGCDAWASFMSGYGGITVAMLPNDVVYYMFSDGNDFRWKGAALELGKLAPYCVVKPS